MALMVLFSWCFLMFTFLSTARGDYHDDHDDHDDCREDQECISLQSCSPVFKLLEDAKDDARTSNWRKHIIGSLRERICGPKNLRKVCCPRSQDKVNVSIHSFVQIDKIRNFHLLKMRI